MLRDGRVAFIDFGIVGEITPRTAEAMVDFVRAFPAGDLEGVAAALAQMGFTKGDVDVRAFAKDLQEVLDSVEAIDQSTASAGAIDETALNRLVASVAGVAKDYGIRFPREFALLVKQVLYFDRYTKILAPDLDVMNDERLAMNTPKAAARGPDSARVVAAEVLD